MPAYCSNGNCPNHALEYSRKPGVLKVLTCKSVHMHIMEIQFSCISQRFSLPQLQEEIASSFIFSTLTFSSKLAHRKHQLKRRSQGGQKWSSINLSLATLHCSTSQRLAGDGGWRKRQRYPTQTEHEHRKSS